MSSEQPSFDDDRSSSFIEQYTLAGRLALLGSIAAGVAGGVVFVDQFGRRAEQSWPIGFAVIAGLVTALAVLGVCRLVFHATGTRFFNETS